VVTVAGSFNCGTNIVIGLAIASRDIKMLSIVLPSVQMVNTSFPVACDRLCCHPVFKEPRSEEAEAAYKTCQKYVWNATTES